MGGSHRFQPLLDECRILALFGTDIKEKIDHERETERGETVD